MTPRILNESSYRIYILSLADWGVVSGTVTKSNAVACCRVILHFGHLSKKKHTNQNITIFIQI